MESIVLILLPVALLVVVGLSLAMFFEMAWAGPGRGVFRRIQRSPLPLLSGDALRRWASDEAKQVVTRFTRLPMNAAAPIALARELEELTTKVIDESMHTRGGHHADRCDQRKRQVVPVTAPEALAIVDQLRRRLSRRELEKIRENAAANAKRFSGDRRLFHTNELPSCPLLAANGCCLSFDARPIHCRGQCLHSANGDGLEASGCEPTLNEFAAAVRQGVTAGLSAGLESADRDGHRYELNSAMARALGVPDASAKWSRGEAVFEGCCQAEA